MAQLFKPTLGRLQALILQQLRSSRQVDRKVSVSHPSPEFSINYLLAHVFIQRIFLVGGFGRSPYVLDHLKAWISGPFKEELASEAYCVNPKHSWTAVVKGAAQHGLESIVVSRVLNKHYGVMLAIQYEETKHAEHSDQYKYIDPFTEMQMTRDNVEWFAAKVSFSPSHERLRRVVVD
jgi:hypothetical protein